MIKRLTYKKSFKKGMNMTAVVKYYFPDMSQEEVNKILSQEVSETAYLQRNYPVILRQIYKYYVQKCKDGFKQPNTDKEVDSKEL